MEPKPKRIEVFACHICGAVFVDIGLAKNCIRQHLDAKELRIHHGVIHIPGTDKLSHKENDPYPAYIEVYSDRTEKKATYVRVNTVSQIKKSSNAAPVWSN